MRHKAFAFAAIACAFLATARLHAETVTGNRPEANYELADRFSQKKISRMVFSTQIRPNGIRREYRRQYRNATSDIDPQAHSL